MLSLLFVFVCVGVVFGALVGRLGFLSLFGGVVLGFAAWCFVAPFVLVVTS